MASALLAPSVRDTGDWNGEPLLAPELLQSEMCSAGNCLLAQVDQVFPTETSLGLLHNFCSPSRKPLSTATPASLTLIPLFVSYLS